MGGEGAHRTEQREECYLVWCEAGHDHLVTQSIPIPHPPRGFLVEEERSGVQYKNRGYQDHNYLYHGNLYERAEKKKREMLLYLRDREVCQGPMDTGLPGPVDRLRGQL